MSASLCLPLLPLPVARPWGGRRAAPRFGWSAPGPAGAPIGEWWLASCHPGTVSPLACAGEGCRTREVRPAARICVSASLHGGSCADACSQFTTAASSHQCGSLRMAKACAPPVMKACIACLSRQTVRVQKTRPPIVRASEARQPSLRRACRSEPNAR